MTVYAITSNLRKNAARIFACAVQFCLARRFPGSWSLASCSASAKNTISKSWWMDAQFHIRLSLLTSGNQGSVPKSVCFSCLMSKSINYAACHRAGRYRSIAAKSQRSFLFTGSRRVGLFYRATHWPCVQVRYLYRVTRRVKKMSLYVLLTVVSSSTNFWATVCKTVRPMLSDRCLSCLWRWCVVAKRLNGSRCH